MTLLEAEAAKTALDRALFDLGRSHPRAREIVEIIRDDYVEAIKYLKSKETRRERT